MNQVIKIEQKPIIKYDLLESISKEVSEKIKSLNLAELEPNEEMLSTIKRTRADLNNDFKVLEEQRKMVKDMILAPYNAFEDKYKQLIALHYKQADVELKQLVTTVDKGILDSKVNALISYFNEENTYDFVTFEDLGIKIIKSKSDKAIKLEIDTYLESIRISLATIEALPNNDRVLAKFQMTKDLNHSISQASVEVQREEQIKKANEERIAEKERQIQLAKERKIIAEAERKKDEENVLFGESEVIEVVEKEVIVPKEVKQDLVRCTFKVTGTREQVITVRNFMKEQGISYE